MWVDVDVWLKEDLLVVGLLTAGGWLQAGEVVQVNLPLALYCRSQTVIGHRSRQ